MNISSAILHINHDFEEDIKNEINKISSCTFELSQNDKIIVLIESDSLNEELKAFKLLEQIPNVASVSMVYSYQELDKDIEKIFKNNTLENILNDDLDTKNILYHGSINHKVK